MRAFYANGVEKMHITWAVEGLPTLLHLSLFFFFGGLIIFLFNADREVFLWVVSWIGLFSVVYGFITLLPLIRPDSPYYSPLSIPAWFLCAGIPYVIFAVLGSIAYSCGWYSAWYLFRDLKKLFRGWMLGGVEKKAEDMAEEQSPKIDIGILGWTISALGDDHSLEKLIEAIPGFFNSKLVDLREHLPYDLSTMFYVEFRVFLDRTFSSNSVIDSVKLHRLDISLSAINLINPSGVEEIFFGVSDILQFILFRHWDQVPKTVEIWHTMAPWCTNNNQHIAQYAQAIVAKVLATVRERDDRWFELTARVYGLPERDLRDYFTHDDDSGSLALLIQLTRRSFRSELHREVLGAFTHIDIRNTLLELQHDFCTLWNEIFQEAREQGPLRDPVRILKEIRHHYIALHQGTDAAPIEFSLSTRSDDRVLDWPSSYTFCDIASHCADFVPFFPTQTVYPPNALPHYSISSCTTISRQVNEATIIARPTLPSHATIPCEIGDSSQAPAATSPALQDHTSPRPTDASPPGAVAAALQNISPAATLSPHPEGTTQQDIVVPCTEPDVIEIFPTASLPVPALTPTLVPVPASTPPVLIKLLESCDAGAASTSDPLPPASSIVGFSIPASPPPSRVPPFPNEESATLLGNATHSRSTGNVTLSHLRARGMMNSGSMCFANAVLQLLVHSPPFWDLFRELGDLKWTRGAGLPKTSDGATTLVDATLRFFEEFRFEEKAQPSEPPQQAAGGNVREDEETKKEVNADSFETSYMYDAMKEKIQLKNLLVRSRAMYRPAVTNSCWPYVYRRANGRMRKSFSVSSSKRLTKNCSRCLLLPVATSRLLLHPEQKSVSARCLR